MAHHSRLHKFVIDVADDAHDQELAFWQAATGRTMTQNERHPEYHWAASPEKGLAFLVQLTMTDTPRPTIVRIWRGRTTRERADEYEAYSYEVGIKPLIEKALGVQMLRENRDEETEFVTISYWENIEAMSRFTGTDPTSIHHLDRDPELLIELPDRVQVLQLRHSHGTTGAS